METLAIIIFLLVVFCGDELVAIIKALRGDKDDE